MSVTRMLGRVYLRAALRVTRSTRRGGQAERWRQSPTSLHRRLQLLTQILQPHPRVGILSNPDEPATEPEMQQTQQQMDTQLAAAREQSPGNKKRMRNRGGRHIATYVEWLVQNGLHGVPVPALARARLRSERDVPRSSKYDARRRVQYGIRQARTWLAAVAHAPSSRPAQPRHRTTRKRSTRDRRKRSPPR